MSDLNFDEAYELVVIGAGHAGIEAALAAARMGIITALFTLAMDAVANMPCNPSIGGTGKSHLVREIDALGGEMAKAADATFIQSRMLNLGKGPAVHSLRAQIDRRAYHDYMKSVLENQENLFLRQGEITQLIMDDSRVIRGVKSAFGSIIKAKAVVIATGTFLNGQVHVGKSVTNSGPDALSAPKDLGVQLVEMGLPIRRFKTGTPCRIHRRSVDFSKLEVQWGDLPIQPFSYSSFTREFFDRTSNFQQLPCYITYTNESTHQIIRDNLHLSPLYGELKTIIDTPGPRYCPSIEDKVVRFPDRDRHQLFLEPMGKHGEELYLQGLSTSLPEPVQLKILHSINGLEEAEIIRSAYAISYDSIDPLALDNTLKVKDCVGLWGAGQFNGTSGYEEAAAQGLIAGINAALFIGNKPEFALGRSISYIGTLIDDLTTKGCTDPYRMMTSRSEYRLLLRQDNADSRLMHLGHQLGLISDKMWNKAQRKFEAIDLELARIKKTTIPPSDRLNEMLVSKNTAPISTGIKFDELLRRPQLHYDDIAEFDVTVPDLEEEITFQVEINEKYEGYLKRQQNQINQLERLEAKLLPQVDYTTLRGLSLEAVEKLNRLKPKNIGQASRISGVSPADVAVLLVWLESESFRH